MKTFQVIMGEFMVSIPLGDMIPVDEVELKIGCIEEVTVGGRWDSIVGDVIHHGESCS